MNDILLVVVVAAVIGTIAWAFYKLFRKTDAEIGDIDGGDVALLATGMQDPSLAVAAYATGEAGGVEEAEEDVDLAPVIAATTVISAVNEDSTPTISEPSTPVTEKVWEHHESPASSHISESVWSHHEPSAPSYESSSSSSYGGSDSGCGGGDCGSCGGGD